MSLDTAAREIQEALDPLPEGYCVKVSSCGKFILVANGNVGFAIREKTVAEGLHVDHAREMLPRLLRRAEGH